MARSTHNGHYVSMRSGWAALAILAVASSCSGGTGVPSPQAEELSDGTLVWRIQEAECSDESACGYGVYVNRWYYDIACVGAKVEESDLGAVFAIDPSDDTPVDEARLIKSKPPSTLALHVQEPTCTGWVESKGLFDDHGLDDPPTDPTQAPPDN